MEYAYIRVSTNGQNIARQLEEIKSLNVDMKNIFIDYQSGKDFNRKNYKRLVKKVRKNDTIIIKSIDRLGRNYIEIGEEWKYLTQFKKVNMIVIDMPILNTKDRPDNLVGKFVADLVLQLLSFIAENERNNIRQRQFEGIKIAKENGVKFGRPSFEISNEFIDYCKKFKLKLIKFDDIKAKFKISKSTFYKYMAKTDIKI